MAGRGGPSSAAFAFAAAVAAVFLLTRAEDAAAVEPGEDPSYPPPPSDDSQPGFVDVTNHQGVDMDIQVAALLSTIVRCEHSSGTVAAGMQYKTFYGGSLFHDLSDHPVRTGEKKGVRLTDSQCSHAGYGPGCVSTAAGAYQIIAPTWDTVRKAGAWGPRLPDFSPESQDEAGRRLLIMSGAMRELQAGNVSNAIVKAGGQWASLPGSNAMQNPKSLATVLAYFSQAGGITA